MLGSRRVLIFSMGFDTLFDCEILVCPEKISLAKEAFYGFYLKRLSDRGSNYCVFASPLLMHENPLDLAQNPFKIQYWATTEKVPVFPKERILRRMFNLEDPREIFDFNKVGFERLYPEKKRFDLKGMITKAWQ